MFLAEALGGMPRVAQSIVGKNVPGINLPDILSFDNEKLKKCGLKLSYHRRKLINSLRQEYLQPWDNNTVPPIELQNELRSV